MDNKASLEELKRLCEKALIENTKLWDRGYIENSRETVYNAIIAYINGKPAELKILAGEDQN